MPKPFTIRPDIVVGDSVRMSNARTATRWEVVTRYPTSVNLRSYPLRTNRRNVDPTNLIKLAQVGDDWIPVTVISDGE